VTEIRELDLPVLETERLRLRAWRPSDLDRYAALCADPEVMRYFGADGATKTREESAEQLAGFVQHWEDHGLGLWCAASRDRDECLGFIGLAIPFFLPEVMPAVEIGWRLARDEWGKGYATEGARRVVPFAFDDLGLDEIVSIARVENQRSWHVMEKLGMTRDRVTMHPEYRFDVVVYRLASADRLS
jgi:RimJ/RimL family protein N-acetyltransferase